MLKAVIMFKKIFKSGFFKSFPLSGITKEVGGAVKEIKEQNNYKLLIRLAFYLLGGIMLWYLILKGLMTVPEAIEIIEVITE